MSKQATDISQIRKYLNGELDARAMHQLERRAQDDPFLMDALEGYQQAKADQQANLDDLASRLNNRVSQKKARIIPLRIISIAASVLIICGAGIWLLKRSADVSNPPAKMEASVVPVAKSSKPAVAEPVKPAESTTIAPATNKPKESLVAIEKSAAQGAGNPPVVGGKAFTVPVVKEDKKTVSPLEQDTTPLNEVIVMNYSSAKKKDTGRTAMLREVTIKTRPDTAPEQRLQAQVPGVKIYHNNKSADLDKLLTHGSLGNMALNQLTTNQVIQGKVIEQYSGLPVKGATVKVSGTTLTTRTDSKGNFRLPADTGHGQLVVADKGYQTRQVNAAPGGQDSAKTIVLKPQDDADASEEIATGYTSQKSNDNENYVIAHPQKGWNAYKKYLKINAVSADGATGVVKLSFTVDKYGSISDIKVTKGLSEAANKKAISLLKDGPEWMGSSNKKAVTLTLRIKFGK